MVRIIPLFILVHFLLTGEVSPLFSQPLEFQVVVLEGGNRIIVRSAPEIREGTAIGAFPPGTLFPYIAEAAGWFQISLPSGDPAWVSAQFSRLESIADPVRVTGESVALFAEPDSASRVLGTLGVGRVLQRIGSSEDGWVQVGDAGSGSGWIKAESIESMLPAPTAEGETQPAAGEGATPGDATAPVQSAEAGADAGTSEIGPGKAEEAVQAYRYALEVNPDDGLAHYQLAVQLEALGRLEEALFHFRRAAELGERETEALQRAAEVAERIPTGSLQSVPPAAEAGPQDLPSAGTTAPVEEQTGATALVVTAAALGTALTLGLGLFFYFRSRRVREVDRLLRLGQGGEGTPGSMPGSLFLKELKAVRARRETAGSSLDRRFQELKNVLASTTDPAAEGENDSQLRKVGELTRFLEQQQSRINALSDLLSLQNDKIAAQEEEIELLRKLLPPR